MPNKAIFLDCDGTLIEDPGYINHPDQVKLLDGVPESLIELKALDYKLIVVSNQSAIARGIVSEKVLGQIHDRLKQLLTEKGVQLDKIYYCPYHPDGVIPKYRKESSLRKPNPGMLLTASDELDIDLNQSWMLGNSSRDVQAGLRAGCKTILIDHSSQHEQLQANEPVPDFHAVNMKEAVNIIKKYYRSFEKHLNQAQPVPTTSPQQTPHVAEETEHAETAPANKNNSTLTSEQLLSSILQQLKSMQREDMFAEFSIMKLIAGVLQVIVLFCLLISVWFIMSPTSQNDSALISLGFAVVFQMMALTFYIMQVRK
jgi:D,D-heptose 1,7-bisphosphate phosphatase